MNTLDELEVAIRDLDSHCKAALDDPHNPAPRRVLVTFLAHGWASPRPPAALGPEIDGLVAAAIDHARRVCDCGIGDQDGFTTRVGALRGHLMTLADEIVRQQQKCS